MSELNPHLGETLHEVFQLLAATLLRINRLAYVAPCLLQARALHAKLKQVQLAAVGMSEGQLSEIEEEIALKAATLAAALAVSSDTTCARPTRATAAAPCRPWRQRRPQ